MHLQTQHHFKKSQLSAVLVPEHLCFRLNHRPKISPSTAEFGARKLELDSETAVSFVTRHRLAPSRLSHFAVRDSLLVEPTLLKPKIAPVISHESLRDNE